MAEIYLMLARQIRIGLPSLSFRGWEKPARASRLEDTIDCTRRRSGLIAHHHIRQFDADDGQQGVFTQTVR